MSLLEKRVALAAAGLFAALGIVVGTASPVTAAPVGTGYAYTDNWGPWTFAGVTVCHAGPGTLMVQGKIWIGTMTMYSPDCVPGYDGDSKLAGSTPGLPSANTLSTCGSLPLIGRSQSIGASRG